MEIKSIVRCITEKFWPKRTSVMTRERYKELSTNMNLKLTQAEIDEGWFFCCEWDDMLINKKDVEAHYCSCLPEDQRPPMPDLQDLEF